MAETVALSDESCLSRQEALAKIAKQTKRSSHLHLREASRKIWRVCRSVLISCRKPGRLGKDYEETGLYYSQEDMLEWAKYGGGKLPLRDRNGRSEVCPSCWPQD